MRSRAAALAAVPLLALAAGCASTTSSSTPPHRTLSAAPSVTLITGTETVTAVATGAAGAADLNATGDTPLKFPQAVWTGLVAATVKPFTLPGGPSDQPATVTFKTPAGNVVVRHSANQVPDRPGKPPMAAWSRSGKTCSFTATWGRGSFRFVSGTGKFRGATSAADSGTWLITARGSAPLKAGSTVCGFGTIGDAVPAGARVTFSASGPMTIR